MTGFVANIESILQLAKDCYAIANDYADIAGTITRVDAATAHLTDKDGAATAADTDLVALVDEFFEYLKTTSSRYRVAAEQLEAAAATYVTVDDEQQAVFQRYMDDWASYEGTENDVRDYGNANWNAEEEADETDRPEGTTEHAEGFGTQENPGNSDDATEEYLDELQEQSQQGGN
ncbi:MAG: hypothetical protein M3422_19785 [Actinomycetota bacterium]|nr:hypothetical protein [Actinomycetota bacterium]